MSDVQNVHIQHLCVVDGSLQECGLLFVFFVVEWWHKNFKICVSGHSVFVLVQRTRCALEYPTSKTQKVLYQEMGQILCPSPTPDPASRKMMIKTICHVIVVMWWHTAFPKETDCWRRVWCYRAVLVGRQHLCRVKMALSDLGKGDHTTVAPLLS